MSDEKIQENAVFNQELSLDDLDAANGGYDSYEDDECMRLHWHDIKEAGFPNCANTVSNGSSCSANDACSSSEVLYTNMIHCSQAWS